MTGKRKRGTAFNPTKTPKRRKRGESITSAFAAACVGVNFLPSREDTGVYSPYHKTLCSHSIIASVPVSSPHPHGEFDEDQFYKVRTILAERVIGRKTQYKIDWEDDERTGEKFAPTWEPKENLTEVALADWEKLKLAKQASMSCDPCLHLSVSRRRV
jgi:hypothetical protein